MDELVCFVSVSWEVHERVSASESCRPDNHRSTVLSSEVLFMSIKPQSICLQDSSDSVVNDNVFLELVAVRTR